MTTGELKAGYPYNRGEWHYVAATGDGLAVRLYIDGREVGKAESTVSDYGSNNTNYFNIGGGGIFHSDGDFFSGKMDEVYVYSTARTAMEIKNRYDLLRNNSRPQITITATQPGQTGTLYASLPLAITATVLNPGTEIRNMGFYVNGSLVTERAEEPWSITWTPTGPGQVTIRVKATNLFGNSTENTTTVSLNEGTAPLTPQPSPATTPGPQTTEASVTPGKDNSSKTVLSNVVEQVIDSAMNRNRVDSGNGNYSPLPEATPAPTSSVPTEEPPYIRKLRYFIAEPLALEYIPEEYIQQRIKEELDKEAKANQKLVKASPTPTPKTPTPTLKGGLQALTTQDSGSKTAGGSWFDARFLILLPPILIYGLVVFLIVYRSKKKEG
jgi:hypothetical protein